MKKFFALLSIAALAFATVACNPDDQKDQPQLPSAAGITPVVTVDGTVVTFALPEGTTGLIPIWYTNESGDFAFAGQGNPFQKTFFDAGTFKVRMYVSNSVGQSADYAEAEFTVEGQEGWNGYNYNSEFNLWKAAEGEASNSYTWYAPGWAEQTGHSAIISNGTYKVSFPNACSGQWQAQVHIVPDNQLDLTDDKNYDFSCLVKINKLCGGVTFKFVEQGGGDHDNVFLFLEQEDMQEGTNIFYVKNVPGVAITAAKMVFDFGWCQDGTEVEISRITLKDHANNDGTNAPDKVEKPEEADPLDTACTIKVGEATNLVDLTNLAEEVGFYYAPGWAQIDNPAISAVTKTGFTIVCPSATDSRWQNQVSFKFNFDLSADKTYDFSCTINSTTAFQYGVKLTSHADGEADGLFFHDCKWHTALEAGKDCTFTIANVPGKTSPARLIFDFGGNPENTTIVVKDICLQEHIN
ncbi:MAG: hypothetical protein IJM05_06450 [Bacteroidales bacterium]|nr:hypothetical protein [Bacteroidales bacterium]